MKNIAFLLVGIFTGIVLSKSEVLSWFRIQEMFRFESFHMYGVMGTAVVCGIVVIALMKFLKLKTWSGNLVSYTPMTLSFKRHILAGSIFGLGWGLVGACPGPMYAMLGNGYWVFVLIILSATAGTFIYGLIRSKLPH